MLGKIIKIINIVVVLFNIIDLFLFPIAVYQWKWSQNDPRLALLGYMSTFCIGWMTSNYIMVMIKEKKDEEDI